ncbi:Uncharacterised protein [Bordetella pertussis]|nr:Uncharacterised protein [Bordetella pertussis]CPN86602.1 Uncharacterised protein [Bordetella pertussis]CPO77424.1 Uncharacterised protein [Bordetella pertussis]
MLQHLRVVVRDHRHAHPARRPGGRRRAGHDHPAGAPAQQGAGCGDGLLHGAGGQPGQAFQFEAVGRQALRQRQQMIAVRRDHAGRHVHAAVVVADHRIDVHAQVGTLRHQARDPAAQRLGLRRPAQVAQLHHPHPRQRAARAQVGQITLEPIQRHGAAMHARIVRRIAQHHRGHRRHPQAEAIEHRHGHAVADLAVHHLRLDRHHVDGQRRKRLRIGGRQLHHSSSARSAAPLSGQ